MNVAAYLKRINYDGSLGVRAQTLRDLQLAHLLAVPFENLSIHANEPIVLTDEALFEKVVERRRGGFCYELSGLFSALLRELGFEVTMLSAGVARESGGFSPAFDHMTLMVSLDARWLVDVGFGDTFRKPLRLDDPGEQMQNGRFYQILPDGEHRIMLERKDGGDWKPQYRFNLQSYQYADYAKMCHHNQTSPESHFTHGRLCSLATVDGRKSLSKMRFITTTLSGDRQEQPVANEEAFTQLLDTHFGIVIAGSRSTNTFRLLQ